MGAVAGERVLCRGGCVAGDLLAGESEIPVEEKSLDVVEGGEAREVRVGVRVCIVGLNVGRGSEAREIQVGVRAVGDGVGSVSAEGEIVDDGAVRIWRRTSEALIIRSVSDGDAMMTERMRKGCKSILDLVWKFMGLNTSKWSPAGPWELFPSITMVAQYDVLRFSPVMWNSVFGSPLKFVFPVVKLDKIPLIWASFLTAQVEFLIDEINVSLGYTKMP